MDKPASVTNDRLNLAAALLFGLAAGFGWIKLKYGLSLIDEGIYLTGGWRLAAGDSFIEDTWWSVDRMYVLLNAAVFRLNPDVTMLGFRQIQFGLALSGIAFMVWIFRRHAPLWLLVAVASAFAFVGLDTAGSASTLSYYTYPHFFLILHVGFFILGLRQPGNALKNLYFLLSGVALWAIGFSTMPLAPTAAAPAIVWWLLRLNPEGRSRFGFRDLAVTLLPVVALWAGVMAWFGAAFFDALFTVVAGSSVPVASAGSFLLVEPLMFVVFVAAIFAVYTRLALKAAGPSCSGLRAGLVLVGLAGVVYALIRSNMLGITAGFWAGWFPGPMWLCALLFVLSIVAARRLGAGPTRQFLGAERLERLAALVPCLLMSLLFVFFSGLGGLAYGFAAIPLAVILVSEFHAVGLAGGASQGRSAAMVLALFVPFLAYLVEHDWNWTYFDAPPRDLTSQIRSGFAKGLWTLPSRSKTLAQIEAKIAGYTKKDDFILAFPNLDLVYALVKRRPAVNSLWSADASAQYPRFRKNIEDMTARGREPALAIVLGDGNKGDQMPYANHPYQQYVRRNMIKVDEIVTEDVPPRPLISIYLAKPPIPDPEND